MTYDFKTIEAAAQRKWEQSRSFDIDVDALPDKANGTRYILVMFPYPSGARLHMGHWYQYGLMDSYARFWRMRGKRVFHPIGFDAFGLPAENYAIRCGVHPAVSTAQNIAAMTEQFKRMGVSYPWRYCINTSDPGYYRWTQWLFLQLYARGLAYRAMAPVNWCPSCQTVLANEQVLDGRCERCDAEVTQRQLRQWFFRITDYAERLLAGLETLHWPAKTVAMQRHWIGRREGAEIRFETECGDDLVVFTTRPDTLFGATAVVIAPEHPLVDVVPTDDQRHAVAAYVRTAIATPHLQRLATDRDKSGVFTGAYARHPMTGQRLPIWVADYVLGTVGSGAVMVVPAHDARDLAFARYAGLQVRTVVQAPSTSDDHPWEGPGTVTDSGPYDGMANTEAASKIVADLEAKGLGRATVRYRLRDWLISRQRYWGVPIPIVHCPACGEIPVPDTDLPVVLPSDVDFRPTGQSPLAECAAFADVSCPRCGAAAKREVDTMDTFVCSSWYHLRFPSAGRTDVAFDPTVTRKMLPVDTYVGGPEHACMHLLYVRFVTMALHDMGALEFDEPFQNLTHQGLVLGPDGRKMSKSRDNAVAPDPYVEQHGSDALRMYLMFGFNYIEGGPWDDGGFRATTRFLDRLWRMLERHRSAAAASNADPGPDAPDEAASELLRTVHGAIDRVTSDLEHFRFHTAVARLMETYNAIRAYEGGPDWDRALLGRIVAVLPRLLAPFAPHFAEHWWEDLGGAGSVLDQPWPVADPQWLRRTTVTIAVMIDGRRRAELQVARDADESAVLEQAKRCPAIASRVSGKAIAKVVYVPGKVLNLVVG